MRRNHADLVIRWSQPNPTSSKQSIAFHPERGRAVIILGSLSPIAITQAITAVSAERIAYCVCKNGRIESQTYTAAMSSAALVLEENKAQIQSPLLFGGKSLVNKVSAENNSTLHISAPAAAILLDPLEIHMTKRGATLVAMHKGKFTREEQSTNARGGSVARRGREENDDVAGMVRRWTWKSLSAPLSGPIVGEPGISNRTLRATPVPRMPLAKKETGGGQPVWSVSPHRREISLLSLLCQFFAKGQLHRRQPSDFLIALPSLPGRPIQH